MTTPTVTALANMLGNNSPQFALELEKMIAVAAASAVATVLDGVSTSMDTLKEAKTAVDLKIEWSGVPATAAAAGTAGQIARDATSLYVCIASGQWVKATLATWS